MAITSKKINLAQLSQELGGKFLILDESDPKKKVVLPAEGVELSEAELKSAIDSHIAVDNEAIKAQAKAALLERLGITEDEAKLLLS